MPAVRNLVIYLLLGLLVAFSAWLAEKLTPREVNGTQPERSMIDYYSKQVKRTVLSVDGKPIQVLHAETMTHYQNDDRTEMERPQLTLYEEGKAPWLIQSETATSLAGGSALLLNGEVLITRENDKGEMLQIITRNVKYDPKAEFAETAEDVIIRAPDDETHATGMQVHFKPHLNFNLLADVRRKHEMR